MAILGNLTQLGYGEHAFNFLGAFPKRKERASVCIWEEPTWEHIVQYFFHVQKLRLKDKVK